MGFGCGWPMSDSRVLGAVLIGLGCVFLAVSPARADRFIVVGVTEAVHDLTLSMPVEGIVSQLAVREGDWIDKGSLILRLDDRLEALEVERRRLIAEDRAQLEAIRNNKRTLASMYRSTRALFAKSGAVSEEEVKKLGIELEAITAREREMETELVRAGIDFEMAREKLRQRSLIAPIAGEVVDVRIDVGESAAVGDPVVRLVDPTRCYLVINVTEALARTFDEGEPLAFEVQAGDGWLPKKGEIISVAPIADPASHLVRILIVFENQDRDIRPGVAGRIRFSEGL